jgi:hypothetical protein
MHPSSPRGTADRFRDEFSPEDLPERVDRKLICDVANLVRRGLGLEPLTDTEIIRLAQDVDPAGNPYIEDDAVGVQAEVAFTVLFEHLRDTVSREAAQEALTEYESLLTHALRKAIAKRAQGDGIEASCAYLAAHMPRQAAEMRDSVDPESSRKYAIVLRKIDRLIADQLAAEQHRHLS